MSFLVDTNVLSELARPSVNQGVVEWARDISHIVLSVITVDEVAFGLTWKPNARIEQWFETFLEEHCRVLPVTTEIALSAGRLRGHLRARGQVRTQADMMIGATALVHGLTLVTRNEADFRGCGIALLNPFT